MSSSTGGSGGRDICQVCGGEASGFHYGVDSCEGCKGFFRRCITQGMTNRCANEEKCEITPLSRNSCQFCRLKKCFAVGMSREGSRLGRRPKNLKKCHSQEPKLYQRTNNFCSSSAISSSPLEVSSGANQSLDSSALEKLRLSVSSDCEFSSSRSDRYQLLSKDRFYCDGLHYPERIGALKTAIHSSGASLMPSPLSSFQHINSLPNKTTSQRAYLDSSPDRLQRPTKIAACEAGTVGHARSRSISLGWSETPEFVTKFGATSQFARGSSSVSGYDPETALSTFIKREELSSFDDEATSSERSSKLRLGADIYDRHDPSPSGSFRVKEEEEEEEEQRKKYSENLHNHWRLKDCKWNDTMQSSSTDDAFNAPVRKMEFPEPVDGFEAAANTPTGELKKRGFSEEAEAIEILILEVMKPPDQAKMRLIKHVITTVVDAHMNTCNYTSQKVSDGIQRYRDSVASGQSPSTRKDLDPSKIWNHFVDNMAPVITRVVKFSKKIPGFSELHQEDQIGLIKQGSFEVILTRYTRLFTEQGMFVPDLTILVPRDVIGEMPMGKFFEEQYQFAELFNQLGLDDAEVGLLTASMIVCPEGRSGLLNSDAIHQLHILLLQSLYMFMKQSHPVTCDSVFSEIIQILPFIRRINASHAKQLNDIKMSTPQIFFPPLHNEVFNKMD